MCTTGAGEFVTVCKQSKVLVLRAKLLRHRPIQVISVKGNPVCTLPVASKNLWNLTGEMVIMQVNRRHQTKRVELSRQRFVQHVPLEFDSLQ
jgi:flavin reductase (DIM6/NTAB) family NADH-FMN oxidoreductase RutF